MRLNGHKLTLIVMGVVLVAFILIKVAPFFESHTFPKAGKVTIKPKAPLFMEEGIAWFVNPNGDTISTISIEIAETKQEISKGLMHRKSMGENNGMLFIFPDTDYRSFWMKNTFIPLDVIFIKDDGVVDSFYKRTTPQSRNSMPSAGVAKFVLEVNGGYMDKHGIGTNSRLIFEKH